METHKEPMKAKELIEKLKELNPESEVYIYCSECACGWDIKSIRTTIPNGNAIEIVTE